MPQSYTISAKNGPNFAIFVAGHMIFIPNTYVSLVWQTKSWFNEKLRFVFWKEKSCWNILMSNFHLAESDVIFFCIEIL